MCIYFKGTRDLFMRQIYKSCTKRVQTRTRKLVIWQENISVIPFEFRCQKRIKSRRVERKSHSKLIQLFKQRPDDIFWSNIKATKRAYRRTLWIKSEFVLKFWFPFLPLLINYGRRKILNKGSQSTRTIYPSLWLVASGNFFLALNRSHHFLLKKVAQWFKLDNFTIYLSIFQQSNVIKFESLCSSCPIEFWLFLTKNDDFYLTPKRNSRMAQAEIQK